MFCPKCGNEIQEGSAFCGKCGAPVGGAQQAASSSAGVQAGGVPAPKKNTVKIGIIAAVAVVVVVLVAGFATNWFGLAGVQPKEAVDVPAPTQSEQPNDSVAESDSQADGSGAQTDDAVAQQASGSAVVKSSVEAYTWEELSQISNEIAAAGSEDAAVDVAKKYNLCTPDGKLDGTQVKSVTLADGTQTTVQIVGFAHDDKTSGGKAGITFMFKDYIQTTDMDASDTNVGGWAQAPIRSWLNEVGLELLPEDLAKHIVAVDKLTNNVGETEDISSVSVTSDALWLFSQKELGGIQDDYWYEETPYRAVLEAEGETYKYAEDGAETDVSGNPALIITDPTGGNGYWWGRSPAPYRGKNEYGFQPFLHFFLLVSHNGTPSFLTEANGALGVVPGFCI